MSSKKTLKGGIPSGMPIYSLTYSGGKGLVEQYFKEHNFPFASHTMGMNIVGHPIVASIKHDDNKAYTTTFNKGGSKKKKDSKSKKKPLKSKKKPSKSKTKKK